MPPLTYQQVRSNDIDVDAQRSLMRMSNRPETTDDANCIAAAVQSGELQGIYAEDQQKPALRARDKLGRGWWTLIPKGEDAVVVIDPTDLLAPPLIAFRRNIRGDQARLDAAILKAWRSARRLFSGKINRCIAGDGGSPVRNIVPEKYCDLGLAGDGPDCCCTRIETITIWVRTFISGTAPGAFPLPGTVGVPLTAVPAPDGRCYLTDQRGFSPTPTAPSRSASALRLDIRTDAFAQVPTRPGQATVLGCGRGADCSLTPPTPGNSFGPPVARTAAPLTYAIPYSLTLVDPCVRSFVTVVMGTFTIAIGEERRFATFTFAGSARAFNIEAYAAFNDCPPMTIMRATATARFAARVMLASPLAPFTASATHTCGRCICANDGLLAVPPAPGPILTALI